MTLDRQLQNLRAHENGFATAYLRLVKGASKVCAPFRGVINMN